MHIVKPSPLLNNHTQHAAAHNPPPSAATAAFGTLETAHSAAELLAQLNAARAAGAPAVLHASAPHAPASRGLNEHLAALARLHPGTRFLLASGAGLGFDAATLPLLIAYDSMGEVVDSLPCVDEALGKGAGRVERGDVAWWLEGVGALSSLSSSARAAE
jgi:hypothetical protein